MKQNTGINFAVLLFVCLGPLAYSVFFIPARENNYPLWLELACMVATILSAVVTFFGVILSVVNGFRDLGGTLVVPYVLSVIAWVARFADTWMREPNLITSTLTSMDWLWVSAGTSLIWFAITSINYAGLFKTISTLRWYGVAPLANATSTFGWVLICVPFLVPMKLEYTVMLPIGMGIIALSWATTSLLGKKPEENWFGSNMIAIVIEIAIVYLQYKFQMEILTNIVRLYPLVMMLANLANLIGRIQNRKVT